jgi:2-dehydropantoate 2-reductase
MINDRPKIAIIGAGAVGGYYGARLAQHGHDVHFLVRSDYHAVRQAGWAIQSWAGDFQIPADRVNVYDDPLKMPVMDLVIVTLKTTSNDQYESLIRPLLNECTAVLTLQNGLGNEERLAELFGAGRVLGGMAFTCINRAGPGIIRHMDHGIIRLGEFGGGPSERASRIAAMFNSSQVPCHVLDDLRRGRWSKLVWNIPFNGLGAALDLTTDRLIDNELGVQLVSAIIREVIAIAQSMGIAMPTDLLEQQIRHTRTMGAYRSSMQIDRQEGRPMEIESILGEPLRQARQQGIPTPKIQMLYELTCLVDSSPRRSVCAAT